MGSGIMLVDFMYKIVDDRSEDFKDFFFFGIYGIFKGCRGIVGGLFLFNLFLNIYKNVRNR